MDKKTFIAIRREYRVKCKALWKSYLDANKEYHVINDKALELYNDFWQSLEDFSRIIKRGSATSSDILNLR